MDFLLQAEGTVVKRQLPDPEKAFGQKLEGTSSLASSSKPFQRLSVLLRVNPDLSILTWRHVLHLLYPILVLALAVSSIHNISPRCSRKRLQRRAAFPSVPAIHVSLAHRTVVCSKNKDMEG